jgi:hypothetical protein
MNADIRDAKRFRDLVKTFQGTVFDGFLYLKPEDYIGSPDPLERDDVVIGELDDIGQKLHTILSLTWEKAIQNALDFISEEEVTELVAFLFQDDVFSFLEMEKMIKDRYALENREFPQRDWINLSILSNKCASAMKILYGYIASRFSSNGQLVIKDGFKIVVLNSLEDDDILKCHDFWTN